MRPRYSMHVLGAASAMCAHRIASVRRVVINALVTGAADLVGSTLCERLFPMCGMFAESTANPDTRLRSNLGM